MSQLNWNRHQSRIDPKAARERYLQYQQEASVDPRKPLYFDFKNRYPKRNSSMIETKYEGRTGTQKAIQERRLKDMHPYLGNIYSGNQEYVGPDENYASYPQMQSNRRPTTKLVNNTGFYGFEPQSNCQSNCQPCQTPQPCQPCQAPQPPQMPVMPKVECQPCQPCQPCGSCLPYTTQVEQHAFPFEPRKRRSPISLNQATNQSVNEQE